MSTDYTLLRQRALVLIAERSSSQGVSTDTLLFTLRNGAFETLTKDDLERQLEYMVKEGWTTDLRPTFAPLSRHWKLSERGAELVMREGLL